MGDLFNFEALFNMGEIEIIIEPACCPYFSISRQCPNHFTPFQPQFIHNTRPTESSLQGFHLKTAVITVNNVLGPDLNDKGGDLPFFPV